MNPNVGMFSWRELSLTDPDKAVAFYTELFGWKVEERDMGPMGKYRLFMKGDAPAGGAIPAQQPGVPSHWLTYVETDDPDATSAKVTELGGKVLVPPTTIPGMVAFGIAMDPQGAVFGFVKDLSARANEALPKPAPGTFCWSELYTSDKDAAVKFYSALFGWTGKAGEDRSQYWHWQNRGQDIGGMMPLPAPNVPPNWLSYVATASVDTTLARAKELGASVMMGPMDLEHVGRFAVLADPCGATFALYQSAHM